MNYKQTPLHIEGITDSLYAGFWIRVGSMLLDTLFILPVIFLSLYFNGLGKNIYFYTLIPNLAFGLWYSIYLPKKYGGTPGKLVAGIKIIRSDGGSIGWKEAILRDSVPTGMTIMYSVWMTMCILSADDEIYKSLNWLKQAEYLITFSPGFFIFFQWVNNIWVYSELIVLLTNKRKRAIHDFMAGTVNVKEKYVDQIRAAMNPGVNATDSV
jgi:uncharacterized RDD family membrane protein YckC